MHAAATTPAATTQPATTAAATTQPATSAAAATTTAASPPTTTPGVTYSVGGGYLVPQSMSCVYYYVMYKKQWTLHLAIWMGNHHQILLSEMSLPGIEVLIEKSLPTILGRLGKENPLKDTAKLPLYSTSGLWRRQFWYNFYTLRKTSQVKMCVSMQGSHECCPVCVCILEKFCSSFYGSLVRHQVQCGVAQHVNRSFEYLQVFEYSRIMRRPTFQE